MGGLGLLFYKKNWLLFILTITIWLSGCQMKTQPVVSVEHTGFAFGGLIQYTLIGSQEQCEKAFQEMNLMFQKLDAEFSANSDTSILSQVNATAATSPVPISKTMLDLLLISQDLAQKSNLALNPVIGPLVKLWSIGFETARVPAPEEITAVLNLLQITGLRLDSAAVTVAFETQGMALDLGSIVKGYAAKEALRVCQEHQLKGALISVNGNVAVYGSRSNGESWNIGIVDPRSNGNGVVGSVTWKDSTIATSGDYERYFEQDGKRYHHLLDSSTGYPAESEWISVSIFSAEGALADALSTTVFVLGKEKGLKFLEQYEDIDFLLIDHELKMWASPNIRKRFQVRNDSYHWGLK